MPAIGMGSSGQGTPRTVFQTTFLAVKSTPHTDTPGRSRNCCVNTPRGLPGWLATWIGPMAVPEFSTVQPAPILPSISDRSKRPTREAESHNSVSDRLRMYAGPEGKASAGVESIGVRYFLVSGLPIANAASVPRSVADHKVLPCARGGIQVQPWIGTSWAHLSFFPSSSRRKTVHRPFRSDLFSATIR